MSAESVFPRAGFFRRFGGWFYDFLIAMAVYMIAGAVSFGLFYLLIQFGFIDMAGYQHDIDVLMQNTLYKYTNEAWKLGWVVFFFVYFWAKSGQTLGMRAWRLRVQNQDGSLISIMTGLKRILPTLLGAGNVLVLFDRKNKLSFQDRLTNTEVVCISLAANKGKDWVN
ncbi:MAG: RDD family protein [Alteromonadaceae bacterium]|nr:RDD family protein [Alteromonadaceae bacterium]